MSAAKTSKKKSNPLVPRMMIDGFERDIQESYIRERAPEILETLLIDRTMTAADPEGRVHRIRWCTDDYGFAADAEIDPELISKPDAKIIRPRVDKRPTFDEHGRKVGQKTLEVGQKVAKVSAKGTEVGQKTLEVGAKGKKLGANPAEVGANGEEVRANFDSVMANYRKDFRETCFKVWQLLRADSSLTQRDIYPRLRLAYSSVQSAYNALQEVGLLRREGRGKGSNWIVLLQPPQPITKPLEPRTKPHEPRTNARKPITKRRVSAKKDKATK